MFSAGTRVCVHASSITGKRLGPKQHSLGYVCSSNTVFYVNYVKNFPIQRQNFIFVPTMVVFTRYGREQKERSEIKRFVQVLPIFLDHISNSEISIRTKKVIKILEGDELRKNDFWRELSSNYVDNPNNIGIIIPTGHTKAAIMTGNEAVSWVSAVLRNDTFSFLVRHHSKRLHASNIVNNDILSWLSSAVRGNRSHKDLLEWATNDVHNMKKLICAMRTLLISFNKRSFDSSTSSSSGVLNYNGQVQDLNSFCNWLTLGLFEGDEVIKQREEILSKLKLEPSMINLYRNLRPARDIYLSIKPKHV